MAVARKPYQKYLFKGHLIIDEQINKSCLKMPLIDQLTILGL